MNRKTFLLSLFAPLLAPFVKKKPVNPFAWGTWTGRVDPLNWKAKVNGEYGRWSGTPRQFIYDMDELLKTAKRMTWQEGIPVSVVRELT